MTEQQTDPPAHVRCPTHTLENGTYREAAYRPDTLYGRSAAAVSGKGVRKIGPDVCEQSGTGSVRTERLSAERGHGKFDPASFGMADGKVLPEMTLSRHRHGY